jgi:hypothetical protein
VSVQAALVVAIAAVFAALVLTRLARAWRRYRGQRVIACPETRQPAGVVVDAGHAAATALGGAPELRLSSCSRWPERAGCGQPCLSQIAAAPEDCLVRNILAKWYEGKTCASCGRIMDMAEWLAAPPALMGAGGVSLDWGQVPADKLHETLAASRPMCFACHTASTLVRKHPELISDRSCRNRES